MQLIGFLTTLWLGFTLLNRVLEGQFIQAADTAIVNNLMVFREVSIFDLFTIPVPNMSFITDGIGHLMKWDYSFFGGNAAIIAYFLYAFTFVAAFLLFTIIIGLVYQYFGSAR